jgi:hypothetical protein
MRIPFLLVVSLALIIVGMIVFAVLVLIVPDAFATIATLDSMIITPTPTPTPTPTLPPVPFNNPPNPPISLSEPLDLQEESQLNDITIDDQRPTV